MLGRVVADDLGIVRVDNQPAVFIGQRAYTVMGIIDDVDRNPELVRAVIIPSSTAAADFVNDGARYSVLIEVAPGAAQVIAGQAAMALRPQDPERLEVLAPPDPGRLRQSIEDDITGLLYGLAGLALLVGMIGIANTTLVAVLERRSEIGVRRALGARRRHIASQFLTESATLGLLGGILGTSLGILAVVVVSAQRDWTTTLDPLMTLPAPIIGAVTGSARRPPAGPARRPHRPGIRPARLSTARAPSGPRPLPPAELSARSPQQKAVAFTG